VREKDGEEGEDAAMWGVERVVEVRDRGGEKGRVQTGHIYLSGYDGDGHALCVVQGLRTSGLSEEVCARFERFRVGG
jgi:hypothetical protein